MPEVHTHCYCGHSSNQKYMHIVIVIMHQHSFASYFCAELVLFSHTLLFIDRLFLFFMFYLWCNLWISYIGSLLYLLIQHSSLHELFCIAAESAVLLCYDTSWICREYSADQYLFWLFTYLARWKQASSLNRTGVGFVSSSCHWKLNNAV
jgi:hypothetical protein